MIPSLDSGQSAGGPGGDFSVTSLPDFDSGESSGSEDGSDGGGTTWGRGNFTSPEPENGNDLADQADEAEEQNTQNQFDSINQRFFSDPSFTGSAPGSDRGDNDSPQGDDEPDSPGDAPGGHNSPYLTNSGGGNTEETDTGDDFNDTIDLGNSPANPGRQMFDFENNALGIVDNPFGDSGFVADSQETANDITTAIGDVASEFDLGGETESDWDDDGQTGEPDNSSMIPENLPPEITAYVGPWAGQNEQESPNLTSLLPSGGVAIIAGVSVVAVVLAVVLL